MTYENQRVTSYFDEPLSETQIRTLLEAIFERRGNDRLSVEKQRCEYKAPLSGNRKEGVAPERAIDAISREQTGTMGFWYFGDESLDQPMFLRFRFLEAASAYKMSLSVSSHYFHSQGRAPEDVVARSATLIQLGIEFHRLLDPLHVVSVRSFDPIDIHVESPVPSLKIDGAIVELLLDWYAIFRPETLERLGTDWLDVVDFHRKERLADDSLLVVLTDRPDESLDEAHEKIAAAMRNPYSDLEDEGWLERRLETDSVEEIAADLECDVSTVQHWLYRHGLD
jgi:hypothetical protein